MSDDKRLNPYAAPDTLVLAPNWWQRLKQRFEPTPVPAFLKGRPIICCGVMFYLQKKFPKVLFAAVPSSVKTKERMKLIVDEVVKVLPIFFVDHPFVADLVTGRRLRICMVEEYRTHNKPIFPSEDISEQIMEAAKKLLLQSPANANEKE